MDSQTQQAILDEYDHQHQLYSTFTEKVKQLIVAILEETSTRVHSVSARVKERDKLFEKISRPNVKYKYLTDLTDIAGIRIITFFDDEVELIADIIEKEFHIDREKSIDKKVSLDPDQFGYLSLHYIVKLSPERARLIEYQKFPSLSAEIQIRSILQHAWAEIEHDLGYKTKLSIPRQIQRRFSRLAGLLELADQEFMTIRDTLKHYEDQVVTQIDSAPDKVGLDKVSLTSFLLNDPIIIELEKQISKSSKCKLDTESMNDVEEAISRLHFFDINTITELKDALLENRSLVLSFATLWLKQDEEDDSFISTGVSLHYLCFVLIAKSGDPKTIKGYVKKYIHSHDEENAESLTQEIISSYEKITR